METNETTIFAVRIKRDLLKKLHDTLTTSEMKALHNEVRALIDSKLQKKYTADNETEEII